MNTREVMERIIISPLECPWCAGERVVWKGGARMWHCEDCCGGWEAGEWTRIREAVQSKQPIRFDAGGAYPGD